MTEGVWAEFARRGGELPPAIARQVDESTIRMLRETAQSYRDLSLQLSALWDRHGDGEFIAASGKLMKLANQLDTRAHEQEERLGVVDPVQQMARWAKDMAVDSSRAGPPPGGVPHLHTSYVEGCFRCDLNKDELGVDPDA